MTNSISKKIFSILLALLLSVAMMPAGAITAFAEDDPPTGAPTATITAEGSVMTASDTRWKVDFTLQGVEGQEYLIKPSGQGVESADWATDVKTPILHGDSCIVEFDGLDAATQYTIYTHFPGDGENPPSATVSLDITTMLTETDLCYGSNIVGQSATFNIDEIPAAICDNLRFQWFQSVHTPDNDDAYTTSTSDIASANDTSYIFAEGDADKYIGVRVTVGGETVATCETSLKIAASGSVFFHAEGAENDVPEVTGLAYGALVPKPDDPTRPGYSFAGWWDVGKDDHGQIVSYDKLWDFESDTIEWGETELYARWTRIGGSSHRDKNEYKPTTGTVTDTKTQENSDGTNTKIVTSEGTDGTKTITCERSDGTNITTKLDNSGTMKSADVSISKDAIVNSLIKNEPIVLPMEQMLQGGTLPLSKDAADAVVFNFTAPANMQKAPMTLKIPLGSLPLGTVPVMVDENGNEQVLTFSRVDEDGLLLSVSGSCQIKLVDRTPEFSDIPDNAWYLKELIGAIAHGDLEADKNGHFSPNATVTAADVSKLLNNISEIVQAVNGSNTGSTDSNAAESTDTGAAGNATTGADSGAVITRGEFITTLYDISQGSETAPDKKPSPSEASLTDQTATDAASPKSGSVASMEEYVGLSVSPKVVTPAPEETPKETETLKAAEWATEQKLLMGIQSTTTDANGNKVIKTDLALDDPLTLAQAATISERFKAGSLKLFGGKLSFR